MSVQKVSDAMIENVSASKLTGSLPALDGSNLTGIDAGGGAWNVISSGTLSGASELIVTGITGNIRIIFSSTVYSTSYLYLRTSTDNGSSFESGGSAYKWAGTNQNIDATGSFGNGGSATFVYIGTSGSLLTVDVIDPADGSNETHIRADGSYVLSNSNGAWQRLIGMRDANEVNNAIRIYPASGTLTGNYKVLDLN